MKDCRKKDCSNGGELVFLMSANTTIGETAPL